ncbi:hypothetical protein ACQP3L_33145, partial [Escherichia coli]
ANLSFFPSFFFLFFVCLVGWLVGCFFAAKFLCVTVLEFVYQAGLGTHRDLLTSASQGLEFKCVPPPPFPFLSYFWGVFFSPRQENH